MSTLTKFYQSRYYLRIRDRLPRGRREEFARALLHALRAKYTRNGRSEAQIVSLIDGQINSQSGHLVTMLSWTQSPQGHQYWFHWHWFLALQANGRYGEREYRTSLERFGYTHNVWANRPNSRLRVGPPRSTSQQAPVVQTQSNIGRVIVRPNRKPLVPPRIPRVAA